MNDDLTVGDVINTMSDEQKNTLCFYISAALEGKEMSKPPYAAIESFDENQKKVFHYLVGIALNKSKEETNNEEDKS